MLSFIIRFIRGLTRAAEKAPPCDYKDGYLDALHEVQEFIEDTAWDEGEDIDDV